MAKKKKDQETAGSESAGASGSGGAGAATAKPKRATKTQPKPKPPQMLPPWKVLLHNDDKNDMPHVISTIMELTTHKERAELYKDQFESKGLVVTIEPAEK